MRIHADDPFNAETRLVASEFTDAFTREEMEALTPDELERRVGERLYSGDDMRDEVVALFMRRVAWAELVIRIKLFWKYTPKEPGEEPDEGFLQGFEQ
jgi:hypothetical protein